MDQQQNRQDFIQQRIAGLGLEEKVGQCFVLGMMGSVVTPLMRRRLRSFTPAGIRNGQAIRNKTVVDDPYATGEEFRHRVGRPPRGLAKDFVTGLPAPHYTNEEFCEVLNDLKRESLENSAGHPLHVTLDMEGNMSADYSRGRCRYFPHPMGLAASGDPRLAEEAAWAVARQVTAVGYSWIHSPVLDVNTNPRNAEISTRSYSEDFGRAAEYAAAALRGFRRGGLIATGKHFPGRGASEQDAHHELPVIDIPEAELRRHLEPFKRLVDAGLPAVMTAHTAYPAFDPSGRAATLSKRIVTDILKGELGFPGCVTTDDITMGGIVAEFEVWEACVEALKAGCDLILMRDEGPLVEEVIPRVIEAARRGDLPEERLDDALTRSLGVKYDYGLFEAGGLRPEEQAGEGINDPEVIRIADESARACLRVLRDEPDLLPLSRGKRVLLVEQIPPLHQTANNSYSHPGLLWEEMFRINPEVGMVEVTMGFSEEDRRRVRARLDEADVVVATNFFFRRTDLSNSFIDELAGCGKPLVVITNNPYEFTVKPAYKTVILTYGISRESMRAAAGAVLEVAVEHPAVVGGG